MGKTTTVTFTKPIDHYAPGDVREVSADELKRLEEYATRWKIKDFYVKGAQTLDQPEVARPSKTTGVVTSDGSKPAPSRPRAAAAVEASEDDDSDQESTTGNDNGGSDEAKAKEAAAAAGEGDEADTTDETDEATELPEVTGDPVTDEGKTPKTATKSNAKK